MINQTVLAEYFSLLCERFNREPMSPKCFAFYKELIEEDIQTTEEFVAACRKIFKYNKFFPAPSEFAEAIGKNPEVKAQEELASLWEVASGMIAWDSISLSPAGKESLRLIGGMNRLRNSGEKDRTYLEKKFLDFWKAKEYLNLTPQEERPIAAIEPGMENAAAYKVYTPPPVDVMERIEGNPMFKGLSEQWKRNGARR